MIVELGFVAGLRFGIGFHRGRILLVLVLIAGIGAGTINVVVGSGTLITFPILLTVGYTLILTRTLPRRGKEAKTQP